MTRCDLHFRSPRRASLAAVIWVMIAVSMAPAVDFSTDIEPIFRARCFECHSDDEQESQFRVDRLAYLLAGGNSGEPSVVPGKPDSSYLLKLIRHEVPGKAMPPDGTLTADQIKLIETWIAGGARTPPHYGPAEIKSDLTHWSFQPIRRPTAGDAIDDFIGSKLAERGLEFSPQAERRVLIRRLYLVMLGLPPTPAQVAAFENDDRPNAWQLIVEDALGSPHYGERWASHWLDLVRFGETHGFETNRERPGAWHYRDWVIDSLNNDKPYDEFVRQQIVGDALGADIATGFLVAGPHDLVKGQDPLLGQVQRMNELDDMINTTGTAFLGLTTGCARCHNHKFDPISQRDYYALQAVFAGVQHGDRALPLPKKAKQEIQQLDLEIARLTSQLKKFIPADSAPHPAVNAKQNEETFAPRNARFVRFTIERTNQGEGCIDELEIYAGDRNVALAASGAKATSSGDFVHPLHKLEHINDGRYGNVYSWIVGSRDGGWVQIELAEPTKIDRILWGRDREGKYSDRIAVAYRIESAEQPDQWQLLASSDDRKRFQSGPDPVYRFDEFPDEEAKQGQRLLDRLKTAQGEKAEREKSTMVYAGTFAQPGPTHRLYRGEPTAKREAVGPDTIRAFASLGLKASAPEQDRRRALADWMVDEQNPLTARVIVNRLWQFHFGTGIVDTPSDFGAAGTPPSHPELLDFLASELIDHDWSLKHIHRLLLTSRAWRQSSRPRAEAIDIDAGSRLLWRFPPRRLEAEAIRDSILAASGVLELDRVGGPGFSPFEVELENVRHYHAKTSYGPDDWRRMIYMTKIRQEQEHVFGVFDCPDGGMAVPRRSRSTTPLQALNLFNSHFMLQQAELFAGRLQREGDSASDQVIQAWQLCFQRDPSADELADSVSFIQQQGLTQFARALLNASEFVFIP